MKIKMVLKVVFGTFRPIVNRSVRCTSGNRQGHRGASPLPCLVTPGRAPLRTGLDQWTTPTLGSRHCHLYSGRRFDPRSQPTPHESTLHAGTARACTLCVHTRQVPKTGFSVNGNRASATPAIKPRPVHMVWDQEV